MKKIDWNNFYSFYVDNKKKHEKNILKSEDFFFKITLLRIMSLQNDAQGFFHANHNSLRQSGLVNHWANTARVDR